MLQQLIRFFLENSKFNYTLFALIILMGSISYITLPKEKFPNIELDIIQVSGGYAGASNDLLDKMAVREIEDEIQSVEGITKVNSVIANNRFMIVLELQEGRNKYSIAEKVKDAVAKAEQNFPADMNRPTVNLMERVGSVIRVALISQTQTFDALIEHSDAIKSKLLGIDGVSNVDIDGQSDRYIRFQLDSKLLEHYGLNEQNVATAIANLSYIYPLGKIEDNAYHFFLSQANKTVEAFEETLLVIDGKRLYVKDIATVQKLYEEEEKIAQLNNQRAISFDVNKYEEANALHIAKDVKAFVKRFNSENRDYQLVYYLDDSVAIKNRLDNVTSNIFLGLILVFFSIFFLINRKMAVVVSIGVPTSFFMAFIYFAIFGLSINLISLLALLIALGVLVDDAIIVSENIQRHLEMGEDINTACLNGTKEVITPVTMATMTTIFTFIPLLFISGRMGALIEMIPIGVSLLVIASFIESFFFLPLHSKHMLKRGDKSASWEGIKKIYAKVLLFHIHYKKFFLSTFLIIIPLLTFMAMKHSKFQMFPKVDIPVLYISGKLNVNTSLEETNDFIKKLTSAINKEEFSIKNIASTAGFRRTAIGSSESGENLFYLYIELNDLEPQNVVDKYITPYLSFDYDRSDKIRKLHNAKILKAMKNVAKAMQEKNVNIEEISVFERRIGAVKVDVEIGILAQNTKQIFHAIETIEAKLQTMKGLNSISNNAITGIDELKIHLTPYAQTLGITERYLSNVLSNLFQANRKSLAFDETELLEIVIEDRDKDSYETLKNLCITTPSGQSVALSEIVRFEKTKSLSSIDKQDFKRMKSVYVNVDTKIITPSEVVEAIKPTLQSLEKEGIGFNFFGEQEEKGKLMHDLLYATVLAIFLIFLALLYMFGSFRYTFMVISVIPYALLGVFVGHFIMGINLTMPSIIGAFGLAGVVINDSIVMLDFLRKSITQSDVIENAKKRFRPIVLTSLTTLIGLSTLIFFVSGQGKILQPIAISLGFGLAWGTILNLIYIPAIFSAFLKNSNTKG